MVFRVAPSWKITTAVDQSDDLCSFLKHLNTDQWGKTKARERQFLFKKIKLIDWSTHAALSLFAKQFQIGSNFFSFRKFFRRILFNLSYMRNELLKVIRTLSYINTNPAAFSLNNESYVLSFAMWHWLTFLKQLFWK